MQKLLFFCCNFGHIQKVKTIQQHKKKLLLSKTCYNVLSSVALSSNPVSKSPLKNLAGRWEWLPWPILIEARFTHKKGSKTATKEGEGGWNQPIWGMPVFRVFLPSNGFPYSLTERVYSSKFGPYNHNN